MYEHERAVVERVASFAGFRRARGSVSTWIKDEPNCTRVVLNENRFRDLDVWHKHIWPVVKEQGWYFEDGWYNRLLRHSPSSVKANATGLERCEALAKLLDDTEATRREEELRKNDTFIVRTVDIQSGENTTCRLAYLADKLIPHLKGKV